MTSTAVTLLDAMLQTAADRPEDLACLGCSPTDRWSWRQLVLATDAMATTLTPMLAGSSGRLVNVHENQVLDLIVTLACMAIGAIEIPIDDRLNPRVRESLISQSRGCVFERRLHQQEGLDNPLSFPAEFDRALGRLSRLAAVIEPNQPSLVLWTSGTTATPRGVMLSHRNLITNASAKLAAVPQAIDDRRLTVLSLAHAYARTCDFGTWLLSGSVLRMGRGQDGLSLAKDFRPTLINVVPSLASNLLHRRIAGDPAWSDLRLIGCGGAALDARTFVRWRDSGVEVIQGYGCTETSPVICSARPGKTTPARVGNLVDGWEAELRGERLFVRGPGVMLGYLDDPSSTEDKIDGAGWLDTGDLVRRHDDGQIEILGRADDVMVLANGFKVHPQAIERRVLELPGIEHAILFPAPGAALSSPNAEVLWMAVQSHELPRDAIRAVLTAELPPGTQVRVVSIAPPLTESAGELSSKQTPRRDRVVARFCVAAPTRDEASDVVK